MRKIELVIKKWGDGEFISHDSAPNSIPVFIGGRTKGHWTSVVAKAIWAFLCSDWKWLFGTSIASIGLFMTYMRFFNWPI